MVMPCAPACSASSQARSTLGRPLLRLLRKSATLFTLTDSLVVMAELMLAIVAHFMRLELLQMRHQLARFQRRTQVILQHQAQAIAQDCALAAVAAE